MNLDTQVVRAALLLIVSLGVTSSCSLLFEPQSGAPGPGDDLGPLARWRINEAATGVAVTTLFDDSGQEPAVNLQLDYEGELSPLWDFDSSGRFLEFSSDSDVVASGGIAAAGGTKLDRLDGLSSVTIETKHEWLDCTGSDGRILEITDGTQIFNGWLSLRLDRDAEVFAFHLTGRAEINTFEVPQARCVVDGEPHVIHWVLDTTAANEGDRVRAYRDGLAVSPARGRGAGLDLPGEVLNLGQPISRMVSLGRPHDGARHLHARIWYAAVYDRALSAVEVSAQANALLTNDDE